ncbi:MAG: hypothetical protein FJ255_03455 [Phycisphaerae bacterium]|nr:hypothetical protein [Phycisphaerae bacterium]
MNDTAPSPQPLDPPIDRCLVIVVGAHLRAEAGDRPSARLLRDEVQRRLESRGAGERPGLDHALICTDLWYLNQPELRRRPTISVGPPEVNALTAYLADKVGSAMAEAGEWVVQFEKGEPMAACWGTKPSGTAKAVDVFLDRVLESFLSSCA